ncbi:spermatogenesis-associated protein 31A6-like, partial [Monodon monoceros]|uniref:spermatogenesis-associated protein 31A6-like n=1 Tax=Monodon monoceros TaxID=40151 RepID=UPI0010F68D91
HQMEPKGRRKINEKKRAVKACRNSLKELEKARDLISLLRSHLDKLPHKGGFHQLSCQDPLGEVGKAAPAAAHQLCREPAEDDAPAVCPSAALVPLTQGSLPVASSLSTEPQDQSNLKRVTLGTVAKSSPPVQKLLELLITKKVKLNTCKEKEKDGSFSEQMSSDYHLNTLGNMWKSLGAEQDNTTPQSFWNMKDKTEQLQRLPGPQQLLHSEVLRDHLEQKYSQLYWGLPSRHSESLLATGDALRPEGTYQAQGKQGPWQPSAFT